MVLVTNHCRECNKDYLECEDCHKTFRTNVRSCPEVTDHECLVEENKKNTAEAAAAGAAGGLAAGTAGGLVVTAGAPAALGALGFTGSGVAGGSIAATLQGLLYAGATPAGGWFATCTSAAMGGAMGAAAVTAVAATGGVAVAAGAGYGIYSYVKKKKKNDDRKCPWCKRANNPDNADQMKEEKKSSTKTADVENKELENEQAMFDRAVALSLESFKEESDSREAGMSPTVESMTEEPSNAREEFICPICAEMMAPPTRIWQCGEGHILCQNCKNHPEVKTCPACRGPFVGRNLAMERMAGIIFR